MFLCFLYRSFNQICWSGAGQVATLDPNALSLVYSVVYNGMFMVPEIILTAAMSLVIARIPGTVVKMN